MPCLCIEDRLEKNIQNSLVSLSICYLTVDSLTRSMDFWNQFERFQHRYFGPEKAPNYRDNACCGVDTGYVSYIYFFCTPTVFLNDLLLSSKLKIFGIQRLKLILNKYIESFTILFHLPCTKRVKGTLFQFLSDQFFQRFKLSDRPVQMFFSICIKPVVPMQNKRTVHKKDFISFNNFHLDLYR